MIQKRPIVWVKRWTLWRLRENSNLKQNNIVIYPCKQTHAQTAHRRIKAHQTEKIRILKNASNRLGICITILPTAFGILQSLVKWSTTENEENSSDQRNGSLTLIINLNNPCILFNKEKYQCLPHTGILIAGSLDSMTICSWIPCKISAASQSMRHLIFCGRSAHVTQRELMLLVLLRDKMGFHLMQPHTSKN